MCRNDRHRGPFIADWEERSRRIIRGIIIYRCVTYGGIYIHIVYAHFSLSLSCLWRRNRECSKRSKLLLMDDPLSHVFLRDRTTEFVSSRRKNSPGEAHVEIINNNDFIFFYFLLIFLFIYFFVKRRTYWTYTLFEIIYLHYRLTN